MFNLNFSGDLSKLNFIGVVSLFGGDIALCALRYTSLFPGMYLSLYFTMVLSPGLQAISVKMFRQMDDMVSRAISGNSKDDKEIAGLYPNGKYKSFGIHTGTKMVVGSILGEILLRTSTPNKSISVISTRCVMANRRLKLKVIELDAYIPDEKRSSLAYVTDKPFGRRNILLHITPVIVIICIVITILAGDYQVFALISMNVICNMLVTFTVRGNGVRYPSGKPYQGAPKGDIFVENSDINEVYLIMGNEDIIQYLFQKPLIIPITSKHLRLFVAYLSYLVSIVNIIWLPFCSIGGQIIFGGLAFFGVVQNIILATFDGDETLLGNALNRLVSVKSSKEYLFETRPSMLAFCTLVTKTCNDEFMKNSLPKTDTFDIWIQSVMRCVSGELPPTESYENNATLPGDLNADLRDAFYEYRKLVDFRDDMLRI
jgi:hypothetical protein